MTSKSVFEEFIAYYKKLPQVKGTCRIFERNDNYSVYDEDAVLINQQILKASDLKVAEAGDEKLSYVNINRSNFRIVLRYLLFVRQYKIEILKNTGTARSPEWSVCYKASPGNLTSVEDLVFGESDDYVQESKGLMAINIEPTSTELVVGVAFCDPVLREIQVCQFSDNSDLTNLQSVIVQLSPQECLVPSHSKLESEKVLNNVLKKHGVAQTEIKQADFSTADVERDLNRILYNDDEMDFKIGMKDASSMTQALAAVAAIMKYLELLSDDNNFGQYVFSIFKSNLYARVDIQSINGLGLFPESSKDFHDKHYLMGLLNQYCSTSMGSRLLVQWIKQPLMDLRKLEERLDIVESLYSCGDIRDGSKEIIEKFPDIDTVCRKIHRRKASLQDLYRMYIVMKQLPELVKVLSKVKGNPADTEKKGLDYVLKSNFVSDIKERIDDFSDFISMIDAVLDFKAIKNKEFVVKAEHDEQLLEIRNKMNEIEKKIESSQSEAVDDLDAPVKLECCKVIGYHFRLTRKEEKNLRHKKGYEVIDTKASGVRFQSTSLKNLNEKYMSLKKSYEEKQKAIVAEVIDVAVTYNHPLKLLSHTIARLDVSLAFATVSVLTPIPYVRPQLKEKGDCCVILRQARHPVLERIVDNFIPNDVEMKKDKHSFYFVTGPNMGGKSTFIRSVALNVLMAQIGCFVPCDSAEISITDAFLTRIGACDKPEIGVSTFMYEMTEMNNILEVATPASLIIIDEMGRGTSTYDGFGLSWAISWHIAEKLKAPCLFATHYHEITELSEKVPSIGNLYVDAITSDGAITFLYRVKPGICDQSYGIHVAQLANFPDVVIEAASEKLLKINQVKKDLDVLLDQVCAMPGGQFIVDQLKRTIPSSDEEAYERFTKSLEEMLHEMPSIPKK